MRIACRSLKVAHYRQRPPLLIRRVVVLVATTDYCNRLPGGDYVNPHLHRVAITLAQIVPQESIHGPH